MLGDTIFSTADGNQLPAAQLTRAYQQLQTPIIALEIVPDDKVSRWLELHHLAAGDPQSWSAS